MSKFILDTSAILACLFNEPGVDLVADILMEGNGVISSANYAELVSKLVSKNMPMPEIMEITNGLDLEFIPQDKQQAQLAGELWTISKPFGLSLGDRSCLALGQMTQLPVLTANKIWKNVPAEVDIRIIR